MFLGPLPSGQQPSPPTSQNLQFPQSLPVSQAPCPSSPTQSGGVEVQGPETGMQALRSEEDKEVGTDTTDATDSSVMTVPEVLEVHGSDHEILEVDGIVEKIIVVEKEDTEQNNVSDPDEPSADNLQSVVTTTLLSNKRKFTTIFEPGVQQYKRTRIIGPHAMKSVAALRAALIGASRPKSPSKFRLLPDSKERGVNNYPEMWARKAFDAWRTLNAHPTDLSIEDLSEQSDVSSLVDMLCDFMSQLTKQNGQSYPPARLDTILFLLTLPFVKGVPDCKEALNLNIV